MAQVISPARSQWTEPEVAGTARLPQGIHLEKIASANMLLYNQQLSNAIWQAAQPWAVATAVDNFSDAPDGNNTAGKITSTASDQARSQEVTNLRASTSYTFDVWLRWRSGVTQLALYVLDPDAGYAAVAASTITLLAGWTRFSIAGVTGSAETRARIALYTSGASSFDVWRPVFRKTADEDGTDPLTTDVAFPVIEYAPSENATSAGFVPISTPEANALGISANADASAAQLTRIGNDVVLSFVPVPTQPDPATLGTLLWRFRSAELEALADGAAIATWPRFAGSNDLIGLAGTRPTKQTVNGRAVARFAGAHVLELLATWPAVGTFYVKYANRTGTAMTSGLASSAVASGNYAAVTQAPILWIGYVTPSDEITGIDPGLGSRLILPWNSTTDSYPVYRDGILRGTVAGAATISGAYLYTIIGRSYNQYLNGDILEVGMYSGVLAAPQVVDLDTYLVSEYGA